MAISNATETTEGSGPVPARSVRCDLASVAAAEAPPQGTARSTAGMARLRRPAAPGRARIRDERRRGALARWQVTDVRRPCPASTGTRGSTPAAARLRARQHAARPLHPRLHPGFPKPGTTTGTEDADGVRRPRRPNDPSVMSSLEAAVSVRRSGPIEFCWNWRWNSGSSPPPPDPLRSWRPAVGPRLARCCRGGRAGGPARTAELAAGPSVSIVARAWCIVTPHRIGRAASTRG